MYCPSYEKRSPYFYVGYCPPPSMDCPTPSPKLTAWGNLVNWGWWSQPRPAAKKKKKKNPAPEKSPPQYKFHL